MNVSLSADSVILEDDTPGVAVKIQGEGYEMNICFRPEEIEKLEAVKTAPWRTGSIKAGKSAGSNVFWSCDKGNVAILVGEDDQMWDFGVFLATEKMQEMLNEIQAIT